ncbi:dermonecrotic toxin domain-containing protein [Pseudomonas donghuensis]|uniref:dermonecrotic toxin domain-containing protein n=1 Tax=Pseudomonas donghuensis TaxID=1163398 RepID=UPI0034CF907C
MQGVTAFAQAPLSARLEVELGLELDVTRVTLTPVTTHIGGLLRGRDVSGPTYSLLQYALHNFSGVYLDPPSAIRNPSGARLAISGLSFAALALLEDLIAEKSALKFGQRPVAGFTLSLFGIPLHDVVLIAPLETDTEWAQQATSRLSAPLKWINFRSAVAPPDKIAQRYIARRVGPLLAYFPGAGQNRLSEYPSLLALEHTLKHRLCEAALRRYFMSFVPLAQRAHFAKVLKRNLAADARADANWPVDALANLHLKRQPVASELFGYWQTSQVQRLKSEAHALAVPTADADEAARKALIEGFEELGLNLLNVAAFFVPGLALLMTGVFAAQLLYSAFEGIEAWEDGDIDTALQHLESIALNIGVAAGTQVAAVAVRKLFNSPLMESLVQVQRADGSERLWLPTLASYRSQVDLAPQLEANALGQYELRDQHYIRLDSELLRQYFDPYTREWRIVHPQDATAYQPVLVHNRQEPGGMCTNGAQCVTGPRPGWPGVSIAPLAQ